MAAIHLIEFQGREGIILQRVDHISTILEMSGKGGEKAFFLVLGNNVKIEILGETRESIAGRIRDCGGITVIIVERPKAEEATAPVVAEPVGNAVLPPAVTQLA